MLRLLGNGVDAVGTLDPYAKTQAVTQAWNGGLRSVKSASLNSMVIDSVNTGDWFGVSDAVFGTDGAKKIAMNIASDKASGSVEVWLDGASTANGGKKVATVKVENTGSTDTYKESTVNLTEVVTGTHKVFFVLRGKGYHVSDWTFTK